MAVTKNEQDAFDELCFYTLAHGSPAFVHQHVVDAFAAQHATAETKPIKLTFALIGLYLHVAKGRTGREVQRVHMMLAKEKHMWPAFALPGGRGAITAVEVLAAPAGPERDAAIDAWCAAVWDAYTESVPTVAVLLAQHGIL